MNANCLLQHTNVSVCVSVRVGVYSMFICSFLSNFQLHDGNVCVHSVYTLHTLNAEHTYMVSLAAREDRCWSYISKTFDFSSYYFNRQWDEHNNKVGLSMKQSNANQVLSKALHLFNAQPNKTTWAELKCSLSLSVGKHAFSSVLKRLTMYPKIYFHTFLFHCSFSLKMCRLV